MDVKLFNYSGKEIFSATVEKDKFLITKFVDKAVAEQNIKRDDIDIKKTIYELNKNEKLTIKSILAIDDDEVILEGYKDILTRLGHYVEVAQNTETASDLFLDDPTRYEFMLVDNILTGSDTNGSEFALKIKEVCNKNNFDVKIYMITGDVDKLHSNKLFDNGINGTIVKPMGLDICIQHFYVGNRFLKNQHIQNILKDIESYKKAA